MKAAVLQRADVFRRLSSALRCSTFTASIRIALIADHIRTILYDASVERRSSSVSGPIHTSRIISDLARNLDCMPQADVPGKGGSSGSPSGEEISPYREVLDALGRVGDAAHIGDGYWVASPPKVIGLDEERGLLIGTLPTSVAEPIFGPISVDGCARFVDLTSVRFSHERRQEFLQTLKFWLGSSESLVTWTDRTLRTIALRCGPPSGVSAEGLEIYAPDIFQTQGKLGRWLSIKDALSPIEGFRICRPNTNFRSYDTPYYWCNFTFADGAHSIGRLAQVQDVNSHRLRFGLDVVLGAPRTAKIAAASDHCVLEIGYQLPEPESRVLDLGTELETKGSNAPRRIRYGLAARGLLRQALGGLGIRINEHEVAE